MSVVLNRAPAGTGLPSLLDKNRTIAGPSFNRWLVPPAAPAIHLCIGMSYGFSVFWLPLSKALGGGVAVCKEDVSFWAELFTTSCRRCTK